MCTRNIAICFVSNISLVYYLPIYITWNICNCVFQSNEVMELEGLKRCLALLEEEELEVSHLVTDRYYQIKKYVKTEKGDIQNWFDCWHVAKGNLISSS